MSGTIDVRTSIPLDTYKQLWAVAELNNTTVGALIAELTRRALTTKKKPKKPVRHGQIGLGARDEGSEYAHRVSFELNHGPVPAGQFVCHRCDNPSCVNPGHLFAGTPKDNSHDARDKGRLVMPDLRGEQAAPAVLAERQAIEIIARRESGQLLRVLAAEFGVSETTISSIATGKTWKHLPRRNKA